jgi:hypothetical protein
MERSIRRPYANDERTSATQHFDHTHSTLDAIVHEQYSQAAERPNAVGRALDVHLIKYASRSMPASKAPAARQQACYGAA